MAAVRLLFGFLFSALVLMAGEPVLLSPGKQFDILEKLPPAYVPVRTFAFQARSRGLYFLVRSDPSGQHHSVLFTDHAGKVKGLIPIPERVEADWMDVAENGDVYLLKRRNARVSFSDEYLVYGSDGLAKAAYPSGTGSEQRVRTGSRFLKLLPSGEFQYASGANSLEGQRVGQVQRSLNGSVASCQSGNTAIFIERKSATAHIVDFAAGGVTSAPIVSGEITAARSTYSDHKGIVVSSVACDGQGFAYLTLSGISLERGAVVLQVNAAAEVGQTLICKLPRIEKYATNGGYMIPALIGVAGRSLFLVDHKGSVAEFSF